MKQPNRMPLYTRPALKKAKLLRSSMTTAEKKLWQNIRNKQLHDANGRSLRFRKQVPIGDYIVDFYCPSRQLVVELDGSQHADNTAYDGIRSNFLASQGIEVIRFWNNEVLTQLPAVIERILQVADERWVANDVELVGKD
jgi:very-short-patch-repair endonuclease